MSLSRVLRLTGAPKTLVMRAPARPASARPTEMSVERRSQPFRPPAEPAGEPRRLLGESPARTGFLRADEPMHPQCHHDGLARHRQILRKPQMGAVYSPRQASAIRKGRLPDHAQGLDPVDHAGRFDRLRQHVLQRGEQQLVELRLYFVHGTAQSAKRATGRATFGLSQTPSPEDRQSRRVRDHTKWTRAHQDAHSHQPFASRGFRSVLNAAACVGAIPSRDGHRSVCNRDSSHRPHTA